MLRLGRWSCQASWRQDVCAICAPFAANALALRIAITAVQQTMLRLRGCWCSRVHNFEPAWQ
eukprot:950413-Alexandrium_andersonii.AAC.1